MKSDLKKITINVAEEEFTRFKARAEENGETASSRIRTLIARDTAKEDLSKYAIAVIGLVENMQDIEDGVDTLVYRKSFERSNISEKHKEIILMELEGALSVKSVEYAMMKDLIDRSEFLNLPTRGAYKPVILKTLAGMGMAYGNTAERWIETL